MWGELFGGLASLLLWASLAYGHGVTYGICNEHAMAVRFGYAGGEPMSYVEVKVFGPESSPDLEFQNGRTDARGVFAFVPDRPGPWHVEAWDNLGHKGSIKVVVEESNTGWKAGSQVETTRNGSIVIKCLLAMSIIANLAFVIALIKRPSQP
jgi:nickel transport protein